MFAEHSIDDIGNVLECVLQEVVIPSAVRLDPHDAVRLYPREMRHLQPNILRKDDEMRQSQHPITKGMIGKDDIIHRNLSLDWLVMIIHDLSTTTQRHQEPS